MIDQIMESIGSFLGQGADVGSIHERIAAGMNRPKAAIEEPVQPEPTLQETFIPDVMSVSEPDFFDDLIPEEPEPQPAKAAEEVPIIEKDIKESLNPMENLINQGRELKAKQAPSKDEEVEAAIESVADGRASSTRSKEQAAKLFLDSIKKYENPDMKGLTTVDGVKRFMMFDSLPGKLEPGMAPYQIGYGFKVRKDWLSDDPSKWLRINDIPVDIRKGLTLDQADAYLGEYVSKDREKVKPNLKDWDKMTEEEKMGWQDLTYNGGLGLLKSNSQAKTAANKGYTMEGLLKLTHFTRAGKDRYRGLLKRRLNNYNTAALATPGAPVVEEYRWGSRGIQVRFSTKILSEKFSKKFKEKVNKNHNWYNVPGHVGGKKQESYKVDKNYQFG